MNRYAVNTFAEALDRIEENGCLFDVGQISESVLTQLYHAPSTIKITYDSWPIRGCGKQSGEWVRVFDKIK